MRYVSPLRSVALSCNIKITYVLPPPKKKKKNVKELFGVNAIILFDTIIYLYLGLFVFISFWVTFLSMLPKQKSVTNITSCYICYIIGNRYVNMYLCIIFMNGNHF